MKKDSNKLIYEEKKALKLFLTLFYLFFFLYDLFYYVILPNYTESYGSSKFNNDGLGFWLYVLVFSLLPLSGYLLKKGYIYIVKYFFLFGYILIDIIDNLIKYYGTPDQVASGNVVELLFLIFAPVYVNKKYFWSAALAFIGKYLLLGLILQDVSVLVPIIICIVISIIVFILLNRFFSYLHSLTSVHEELRQKERLAIIGQMATAIGHEIRNPIASLKGFIQLQKEQYPNTNDYYSIMIQEVDRIDSIIDDLLYIGKPRVIQFNKGNIKEIIDYTISLVKQQDEENRIVFKTKIEDTIPEIDCVEKRLKQVLINLIKNAIEAMPQGGKITISAGILDRTKVWLSIEDEGVGIKEEYMSNISVPFFTTKKDGTGLGLMVTEQIIKAHNGEIRFESTQGKGTKVMITLPLLQNGTI
ncbi:MULTISPECIES: ATP-binding protein [Neobacillus]|jgi:signal transduction histidine kinase|uniref:histidine kinase n=1 Tax=Neobacillus sedimentimangrovi TaxID=2699460 RepID=A0ABS8QHF7_9BACI|nr:ATP-binding protein [Neobacillus sedimentimangrovi]MCD4838261.1 ATP-binding protein [Neobacillus sedimentimangrovi]